MAENTKNESSKKRGGVVRVLAPLGLFAAGYLAGRFWLKPVRYAGSFLDRALRRVVFQSIPETRATQERPATSLVAELSHKLYLRFRTHNLPSVAASAAFFVVLAIFPGLAALVSLYGLIGDPANIGTFIDNLGEFVPTQVIQLLHSHFNELISRHATNLSAFLLSLLIALWSSMSGMKAVIEALNVVFDRVEERSIIKVNILAAWMTLASIAVMGVAVNIMILPELSPGLREFVGERVVALRWPVLFLAVLIVISAVYYIAPCGRQQRWYVLTAGATLAGCLWIALSMLFSLYITNFANYSVTYGSLGAAAVFMTWLWLTIATLLVGAEVDATVESLGD